jgi:hypothetical protein
MVVQREGKYIRRKLVLPGSRIINYQTSIRSLVRNDEVGYYHNGFAAFGRRSWLYPWTVCLWRCYGLDDVRQGGMRSILTFKPWHVLTHLGGMG